jgi:hypothetical protein
LLFVQSPSDPYFPPSNQKAKRKG